MPITYYSIASTTLSVDTNVITFNNIPNTYTDLLLVTVLRSASGGNSVIRLNNSSSSIYNYGTFYPLSGGFANYRETSQTSAQYFLYPNQNTNTADLFSNAELYIANYAGSANKQIFSHGAVENASTTPTIGVNLTTGTFGDTTAISRIDIWADTTLGTTQLRANSGAWLYGITKH